MTPPRQETSAPPSTAFRSQTRKAMLTGVESNRIIVGAYTDRKGGVCPMLAAHRGGRTSLASFAHAWDRYTGCGRRARPAIVSCTRSRRCWRRASRWTSFPALEDVAREVKKLRQPRLFRRFDEYERAVAELGVIRALNPQDERTELPAPRSVVTS